MEEDNVIICEICYEENEPTRVTCKNCGAKLYKNNIEEGDKQTIKKNSNVKVKNYNTYSDKFEGNHSSNNTAVAVKVIARLEIIFGFILGIILRDTFGIGVCISTIIVSIVIGVFILGFGEIIQLLQDIKDKR